MTVRCALSGAVARIQLDRPPLNVLDIPTSQALTSALRKAGKDPAVRVVVLSGRGKCFSAGVDIRDHTRARVKAMLAAFHAAIRALQALEKPTVAVVHGHCLGGGMELALACDFVVADPKAVFALPEITLACYPPVAALLLPRVVGTLRAKELVLLGEGIPARKALALGLVTRLGSEKPLVARLLSLSGSALACAKAALKASSLRDVERIYLSRLVKTPDMDEGVKAFLQKRRPRWQGVTSPVQT